MSVKAVMLVALLATRAVADSTDRCIAESETGQRLVLTRHFVEARQHLIACGGAACPTAVSADCIDRLHQAEASAATVVVSAEGAVRAFIDDIAAPLGEAVWIDPGAHRVRFERGRDTVTANPIVAEGARLQRVTAAFAAAVVVELHPRAPVAIAVAGGIAVIAGGVLGLVARSRRDDETQACASPSMCVDQGAAQRAYDSANHYATASTITVAAGAALLAGAAVWWWRGATVIAPAVGPHDVGVALVRAF